MKISQNWLSTYIDLDVTPETIAAKLTQSGLEVSSIHVHQLFPDGLVVGRVKACIPHPDADRLKLTTIDIGDSRDYQIVCGAKNIAQSQSVLVATPGTILSTLHGGSIKIKKKKIRGKISEGMVCSKHELGLEGQSDEIWVLDNHPRVGTEAKQLFNIPPDTIYDLEITPNRNDACSHLGVARELGALFNKNISEISTDNTIVPENNLSLQVSLKEPSACPRYTVMLLDKVQVVPSPIWLQDRLKAIGIKPHNNIVDITNFITHAFGQPIHAFDYDKIYQKRIIVKHVAPGTTFKGLDGVERILTGQETMICDGEKPIAMGGIIGGEHSKVTETTQRVVIESAYFDPITISKTARHHNITTDASYRFERGTDPDIPYWVLHRTGQLIKEIAGAMIAAAPVDIYPNKINPCIIETSYHYLEKIIGIFIPSKNIQQILQRLDMAVKNSNDENIIVTVPPYRRDVTRPIDLVEEVLRIYGYDRLPTRHKRSKGFPISFPQATSQVCKNRVRKFLTIRGFHEAKHAPLIPAHYHEWISEIDTKKNVSLANPLSGHYTTLPQSLLFGGLATIHHNYNRQQKDLSFFEIAKHYSYQSGKFDEKEHLAIWITGHTTPPIWHQSQKNFTTQDLQAVVLALLNYLGFPTNLTVVESKASSYQYSMTIQLGDQNIITLGEVAQPLLQKFKISQPVFFATASLASLTHHHSKSYQSIAKYPSLTRDISIAIPSVTLYQDILAVIGKLKIGELEEVTLIDCYQDDSLKGQKSYTLRLKLRNLEKTLEEKEVTKIVSQVVRSLVHQAHATLRE
ncbi:MAG: phenylalanine--tRNA ligase subunit beta [Bacteroidota bacterium]